MDQSLSSKLAALQPTPAPVLVSILAPFLLHIVRNLESSERVHNIHNLLESWYVQKTKTDISLVGSYTTISFPDTCFQCGAVYSSNGSVLRHHCNNCKKRDTYILKFVCDLVYESYAIHPSWIEAEFSKSIMARRLLSCPVLHQNKC